MSAVGPETAVAGAREAGTLGRPTRTSRRPSAAHGVTSSGPSPKRATRKTSPAARPSQDRMPLLYTRNRLAVPPRFAGRRRHARGSAVRILLHQAGQDGRPMRRQRDPREKTSNITALILTFFFSDAYTAISLVVWCRGVTTRDQDRAAHAGSTRGDASVRRSSRRRVTPAANPPPSA